MFSNDLRTSEPTLNWQIMIGFVAMLLLAVITGLAASTANLVLIVMLVGLMVGVALIAAPRISVWIIIVLGLTCGFIISTIGPSFGKLAWAVVLMSMLLVLPCIIKLMVGTKGIPTHIWLALAFVAYTVIVSILQRSPMSEYFAGFKRFFQMYGLMLALALLDFKEEDHRRWLKLMLFIALIQLPFALYEYIVLVPLRLGLMTDTEATDVVAGTLGANLVGGSANGEMVAFLIMALAFVMARWRSGLIGNLATMGMTTILMFPLVLSETKIVVVLLPMVWFIVMRKEITKKPIQFVFQLLALLIITVAIGSIYIGMIKGGTEKAFDVILGYNAGSQGYGGLLLNRTTVYSFWWDNQGWQDPLKLLIGNGLGSSFSNPDSPVGGRIGMKYFGYGIDLTAASALLWDTGLIGLLLFLSILASAWVSAGRLWGTVSDPSIRADALAIQACIAILMIYVFYDSTLVNILSFELIAAFVLGHLGYLVRVNKPQKRAMPGQSRLR